MMDRNVIRLIVAGLAMLAIVMSADASRAEPYWQIHEKDDVAELRALADKGDAGAQFQLGTKYLDGRWINKDVAEGLRWLTAASEQGFVKAQLHLGTYYADITRDDTAALVWLRRAAENNTAPEGAIAARKAGVVLSRNPAAAAEAARYLRQAAERDEPQAQVLLGTLLIDGRGIDQDFNAALQWIERAAAARYAPATYVLTFIYAEGFGTSANAAEAAARLAGPNASRSEAEALYILGAFYHKGFWLPRDDRPVLAWVLARMGLGEDAIRQYFDAQRVSVDTRWADWERAIAWYRKGAEAGHIGAQVNLGLMHLDVQSSRWDCGEAVKWMRTAADRGDPTAQLNLGSLYLQGPDRTVTRIGAHGINVPGGVRIESIDANGAAARADLHQGDHIISVDNTPLATYGMEDLSALVQRGRQMTFTLKRPGEDTTRAIEVTPDKVELKCPGAEIAGLRQDASEAVRWFEKAADGGHPSGLFFLARAYREGTGTARNPEKALELYRKGAGRGDWQAAHALFEMYAQGEGVEKNQQLAEEWYRKALQFKHRSIGRN